MAGLASGFLNGLFGAGGGMVAVPMLHSAGLSTRESHATSIAIILPLTLASSFLYYQQGQLSFSDALPYLPGGLVGALVGAWLLKKVNPIWLHRLFGLLILFAAVRLLIQ